MNQNNNMSRITIDIPKESHKKFKETAALLGKSMRQLVIESIEQYIHSKSKYPNKKTLATIKKIESGKDLVRAKDAVDLFKKLGL